MPANFANPRKKYNWSIGIVPVPINPFLFQKVDGLESSITQDEHGDTNHNIKTAGRVEHANIKAEKLMPSNASDTYMWDWHESCQSSLIGGGLVPTAYKKTIMITEFAEDGVKVLNTWTAFGVWPCKINSSEYNRGDSGNAIETVEFSVDELKRT
jgi:phage tail-like protein